MKAEELSKDAKSSRVSDAQISQPACTAVQLALTDLLKVSLGCVYCSTN